MPAEHRWSKFWWQDWQREPSLRMCSLGARGLWMDLLCIAHDGDPYGHVTVNGRAPTPKQIASIAGTTEKDATACIRELEDAGVFSRTEEGVMFCRRMVRDKAASEKGRAFGKSGGNPNLKGPDKGGSKDQNQPPDLTGGVKGVPNLQEAEAEAEAEAESKQAARASPLSNVHGLDHVQPEPATGRSIVNGWYLDRTQERVFDAAQIDSVRWTGNIKPLITWLSDGIEPDIIVGAIRKRAEQAGYSIPHSLGYFDKPVREAHGRVHA